MASPSPAVLLKLLVLEEEREMLARPFSFNFMKGLWGWEATQMGSEANPPEDWACLQQLPQPLPVVFVFQRLPEARPVTLSLPGGRAHKPGLPVATASISQTPSLLLLFVGTDFWRAGI